MAKEDVTPVRLAELLRMVHLIVCREYPPAPYPAGGIGTYAMHIARLMAEAGQTVHMIAQRWEGAPDPIARSCNGRLIVHRIPLDVPCCSTDLTGDRKILRQLASSTCPSQVFSWQAAKYVERLLESESVDVIEGQEWEAPLYYLQVRRALGLSRGQQPPILVHLHSPSAMIFRHNEWDPALTDFLPLCQMEEYTITAADALVCPSRYLADGVSAMLQLAPDRVQVLPYPMGETERIDREPEVWRRDAICYVGRMELRKGVVEWVDAAVTVAGRHSAVSFDFIGADTSLGGGVGASVLDTLKRRIPPSLQPRFRFHGSRTREELVGLLSQVAVAVIPSRWENFPYTCVEAMATGLPVLISPNGGMAELVEDGESGWVAADGTAAGLEAALLRVLATPPGQRQAMGQQAADTVRRICANDVVVRKHLLLRGGVADAGPGASRVVSGSARGRSADGAPGKSMGIVVTCSERPDRLKGCIESILKQTIPSKAVIVIREEIRPQVEAWVRDAAREHAEELLFVDSPPRDSQALRQHGLEWLLASGADLRSAAWIDQDARLDRGYVAACESVLDRQPGVGAVASWTLHDGAYKDLDPGPAPVSSHGLHTAASVDLPKGAAFRIELLLDATGKVGRHGYPSFGTLAEGDWSIVTYPGRLLSILQAPERWSSRPVRRYSAMALIQSNSPQFAVRWFLAASWAEKVRWFGRMLHQRQRVARWAVWQIRRRLATT